MMFLVHSHQCPDYMSNTVVSDDPGRRRHSVQGVLDRWSKSVEQLTTISPLC